MDSSIHLYNTLDNEIDKLMVQFDNCFDALNSITIWQVMNGIDTDNMKDEFEQTWRIQFNEQLGEEAGSRLAAILFD